MFALDYGAASIKPLRDESMGTSLDQTEDACEMPRCTSERGLVLTLRGALFINGRAELNPVNGMLERLLTVLSGYPESDITIEGHTDTLGSEGYNYNLSQRRADSIKLYLLSHGVVIPRITALGRGGTRPLAANFTAEGRWQNARIEVIVHTALAAG
jgi:OOP family OmpA-OmpF porin